jgi:DNA-binding GntR family transcriptional regulator
VTEVAERTRAARHDGSPLVDRLATTLRGQILSGAIPLGSRLRQEALADEFGVSRTPVREALRKLQATGLVQLLPNRGAIVRGPSARDIREAYVVRAELEGLAAELAATAISDDDLRRLRDAEQLFRRCVRPLVTGEGNLGHSWDDESEWVRANDLFHQAILDASGNARLSAMIAEIHQSFPRRLTWAALAGSARLLEENVAQHAAILAAIEEQRPDQARRRMVEHVRSAGELISRHFEKA